MNESCHTHTHKHFFTVPQGTHKLPAVGGFSVYVNFAAGAQTLPFLLDNDISHNAKLLRICANPARCRCAFNSQLSVPSVHKFKTDIQKEISKNCEYNL